MRTYLEIVNDLDGNRAIRDSWEGLVRVHQPGRPHYSVDLGFESFKRAYSGPANIRPYMPFTAEQEKSKNDYGWLGYRAMEIFKTQAN